MTADRQKQLSETTRQVTPDWAPSDESLRAMEVIAGEGFFAASKAIISNISKVTIAERERLRRAIGSDDALELFAYLYWQNSSGPVFEGDDGVMRRLNLKKAARDSGLSKKKVGHVLHAIALSKIISGEWRLF